MKIFKKLSITFINASIAASMLGLATPVHASTSNGFPNRPITIVVPYPAGGGSDSVARIVARKLNERLGQPIVVENVAGASSMIGASKVARSKADGYTLLMATNTTMSTNPWIQSSMSYDVEDFTAISQVIKTPLVLLAHPGFSATDVETLVSMAKKEPGKLAYASFGTATTGHIGGELFKKKTNIDMFHVPYKGSAPAIHGLISGVVPTLFDTASTALAQIKAGKARGLAVMQPERSALAPDIPSMREAGYPDIDISVWFGLLAPKGTPENIVQLISKEVQAIVKEPAVRESFANVNVEPVGSTPTEFAAFLERDRAEMGQVIRDAHITAGR